MTGLTLGEGQLLVSEPRRHVVQTDTVGELLGLWEGNIVEAPGYRRVTRRVSRRRWQHCVRFVFRGEWRYTEFVTKGNPFTTDVQGWRDLGCTKGEIAFRYDTPEAATCRVE